MDQDKTAAEIARADEAAYLLSHHLYKAAFADIERELFELLAESNMHDTGSQQELLRTVKNLRRLRGVLENHVNNGVVAKESLRRSQLEKAREFLGL